MTKFASEQLGLTPQRVEGRLAEPSAAANKSLPMHRWANWIAGFSGEFARSAIRQYRPVPHANSVVMDPFSGVGTTLIEAYRQGVNCVGFELNPFAALVSKVKLSAPSILHAPLSATLYT